MTSELKKEIRFSLADTQVEKLDEWIARLKAKIKAWYTTFDGELRVEQVPWPQLEYTFIPNGVGTAVTAFDSVTGETIDLTEMDKW